MLVSIAGMYSVMFYGSYAIWLMMPYLTDEWGLSITQAAAVINIFDGVVAVLPMGLKILVDFLGMPGDFWIVLLSGVTSTLGLAFVTISSTLNMFGEGMDKCSNNEEEKCTDTVQRGLMFSGLGLLAVGMATCLTSPGPYITNRLKRMNIKLEGFLDVRHALGSNRGIENLRQALLKAGSSVQPEALINLAYQWPTELWLMRSNLAIQVPLVVLVFVAMPWCWRFGVPVIILAFATLMFLIKPWYNVPDHGAVDVVTSTASDVEDHSASAPLLGEHQEDQEKTNIIRTIPLWPAFLICGLVSSIGNTYFMEQSELMSHNLLGKWEIPSAFFVIYYKMLCKLLSMLCELQGLKRLLRSKGGIAFSLLLAVACCITAALVEAERLHVAATHGLIGIRTEGEAEDEGVVPLSVLLMLPQFFLLAFLDTAYGSTVFPFFGIRSATYANCLMNMALGLGILGGVASVYIAGSFKKDWFRHTLNGSRLDKYYWMLAVLSAVGLIIYWLLIFVLGYDKYYFGKRHDHHEGMEGEEEEDWEEQEFKRLELFEYVDFLPLRR